MVEDESRKGESESMVKIDDRKTTSQGKKENESMKERNRVNERKKPSQWKKETESMVEDESRLDRRRVQEEIEWMKERNQLK